MSLKVLMFGILAEVVSENEIIISDAKNTDELVTILIEKYPKLEEIKYAISVNHKIINKNTSLNENDEIALLPPFAGG